MKAVIKRILISILPLALRKRLAIAVNRSRFVKPADRGYWATQLLTDFAAADANAYHKFLWANHLAYAETYEIGLRFGYENLNETRKMFFAELPERLAAAGIPADDGIDSVLEVGCSLGYLLRYIETDVFPRASRLEGIDIDGKAIAEGAEYLASLGSGVKLHEGDMVAMGSRYGADRFDFVLGSGVLLYLDEPSAEAFVEAMLASTGRLLAITALAHPDTDNRLLERSQIRERDGTWIHNVDRMLEKAGARIVGRRWQGGGLVDGNTVYFLYAVPGRAAAS